MKLAILSLALLTGCASQHFVEHAEPSKLCIENGICNDANVEARVNPSGGDDMPFRLFTCSGNDALSDEGCSPFGTANSGTWIFNLEEPEFITFWSPVGDQGFISGNKE